MIGDLLGLGVIAIAANAIFGNSDKTTVTRKRGLFRDRIEMDGKCYSCDGSGRYHGKTCRKCGGTGRYHKTYYR